MNLIIDIGNSFVKLAVFQKDLLMEKKVAEIKDFQLSLEDIFQSHPKIERTILSSVTNGAFSWTEKLKNTCEVLVLNSDTPLPFINRYSSPQSLGNDRKAVVAAAAKNYPHEHVMVIDAGTCLTYDFKSAENEYFGGGISPGLNMRYRSLNSFTAKLPLLKPEKNPQLIGSTTERCIHSGVIWGMQKEIEGVINEYESEYEGLKIILTGGDAHFLSMRLKNSIFANSSFLLEGLNYILEFNKTQ